jgi:hypothetical protein
MPIPSAPGVLIVDADISRLAGREDVRLGLLDTPLGDGLAVHGERRLATLADSAAVVGEVEDDRDRAGGERFRSGHGEPRQPEEVRTKDLLGG